MTRDEAALERMARLLCRLDAFRNCGKIGAGPAFEQHVESLWVVFKEDAGLVYSAVVADPPPAVERAVIARLRERQQALLDGGGRYDWVLYATPVEERIAWLDNRLAELDAEEKHDG